MAEALELERLIEEEHKLQAQILYDIENSMSDANIERVARERLGFIRSNEIIFFNEHN